MNNDDPKITPQMTKASSPNALFDAGPKLNLPKGNALSS